MRRAQPCVPECRLPHDPYRPVRSHLAGKYGARAGGLSKFGGVQDDRFAAFAFHREISLGAHGDDREVDRTPHLFASEPKSSLLALPRLRGTQEDSIRLKLASRIPTLLRRVALGCECNAGYTS